MPGLLVTVVGDEHEELVVGGEDASQTVKRRLDLGESAGAIGVPITIAIEIGWRVVIDRVIAGADVAVVGNIGAVGNQRDDVVVGEAVFLGESAIDVGRVLPIAPPVVVVIRATREDHGIAVLHRTRQAERRCAPSARRWQPGRLRGVADRVGDDEREELTRLVRLCLVKQLENRAVVLDRTRGKIRRKKHVAAGMLPTGSRVIIHKEQPARWPGSVHGTTLVTQGEDTGVNQVGAAPDAQAIRAAAEYALDQHRAGLREVRGHRRHMPLARR